MIQKLSIVIPLYNEERNVQELLDRLTRIVNGFRHPVETIVVDDGSADRTIETLKHCAPRNLGMRIVVLRRNFGQAQALAAGFDQATGDVIVSLDGDLQHAPEDLPAFLDQIEAGYDIVSGWRKERIDNFFLRRIPSMAANAMMAKLSGVPLHDFGTTFKAYRRDVFDHLELYPGLHRFIPALVSGAGFRITEIPIQNVLRKHGKSNYGLTRIFHVFFDLLLVKFLVSYAARPLKFFGSLGAFFVFLGGATGAYIAVEKFAYGVPILTEHGPLFLFAIFGILLGIQFIMMGFLGELMTRVYHRTAKKKIYTIRAIINPNDETAAHDTRAFGGAE